MEKSKVLIVGGTGYIGRRLVRASLALGHPTYVLQRSEMGLDIEKLQLLLEFKRHGARLVQGSFSDHRSLVEAVRQVDVVVSAVSGVHIRGHSILLQLKLVEAIKEAGNVKRFLPSEFGTDPSRMEEAVEPGRETFDQKMVVRRAIEEANIPFTYVSSNCFAGYMVGGLCQLARLTPPHDVVHIYGDGNRKAIFVEEEDIATYTMKTIDDPRTLNKTLYMRPPQNILSQLDLVRIWEEISGNNLQKIFIPGDDLLASMKGKDIPTQAAMGHFYHFFVEGCLINFDIGENGEEASNLYPEVRYTRMDEYLKIYL